MSPAQKRKRTPGGEAPAGQASGLAPPRAASLSGSGKYAFSLIEVLVALAIFAMTVAVLAQALNNAMTGLEASKTDAQEAPLYRFALRQILQIEDREEVEDGGSLETPEDGAIDWSAAIEETDILDLFLLTVEMEHSHTTGSLFDRAPGHRETLYVYRPSWSDSLDRGSLLQDKQDALRNERLRR